MAIYVCADLHLQHKRIIDICRRQFTSITEHDEFVISSFNSVVQEDDVVYILGDVGFTPKDTLGKLVKRLNGYKILLVGNHDRLKDSDYLNMGFIKVIRHPIFYNNNIVLSHIPVQECFNSPYTICIHGHLHQNILTLPNFFNVNVELHDFKPMNIKIYEEKAKQLCLEHRWQPFGSEWYKDFYKKDVNNGK